MTDMTNTQSIGFVAIARPTFDIPFAEEKTASVREHLTNAGFTLIGPDDLVMDVRGVQSAINSMRFQKPALLVILQASFADSTMINQIAKSVELPILLWALPEERTGGRLRLNSFCGINLAAHSLKREGIKYESIYAHPDDPTAIEKIDILARAADVRQRLKTARIGRVGENPDGFDTCLFNGDELKSRFGLDVVQVNLQTVFAQTKTTAPERIDEVEAQVREKVSGMDEVNQEEARGTLATYLTLLDIADEQSLNGIAVRCWPEFFTDLGCSACGAMSMMTDSFTPSSCEADVNGTITQLMLQWISGEPSFGTDMVDFDVDNDTAVVWHCGLAPLSMADPDSTPTAALHSNRQKPLLMQFPLKPGRVTIARLSEAGGKMRLVIGSGEMIKAPPAFSGTSGTIRFDSETKQVMETILNEGLEHHISIAYGDHVEVLKALAKMLDLPVLML